LAIAERYQSADVVALVEIDQIRNLVVTANSFGGAIAVNGQAYVSRVVTHWKSAQDASLIFHSYFSRCAKSLKPHKQYLVFLDLKYRDVLHLRSCDRAIFTEGVSEETLRGITAKLDQLGSPLASGGHNEN
jgi:hypothetical protein